MNILERAKSSGKCPPSLFAEGSADAAFEAAIAKVLDPNGEMRYPFARNFCGCTESHVFSTLLRCISEWVLSSGVQLADDFKSLIEVGDR